MASICNREIIIRSNHSNWARIAAPLVFGVLAAGCGRGPSGGAASPSAAATTPPVAIVNGKPISLAIFELYVKNIAGGRSSGDLTPQQRSDALDSMVRAELAAEQAAREGFEQHPDVQDRLALARVIVLEQASTEHYLRDHEPSEAELRAEYELQISHIPRQEYQARQILVATQDFANKLVERLDHGASFAELAQRESMDPSKQNGGEMGWVTLDRIVPPVADTLAALKPGEYTHAPVATRNGWYLLQLEATRPLAPPPYDAVRDRLRAVVSAKKFKAYTDELLTKAKIEKKL
jgi:peptidyl-prolyl cis-trans isomerase C